MAEIKKTKRGKSVFRSLSSLAVVCRTCKAFSELATPLLYHTYVKPNTIKDPKDKRPSSLSLPNFLRTIILRPELAKLVKTVAIGPWEMNITCWQHAPLPDYEPSDETNDLYSQAVSKLKVNDHDEWVQDLPLGSEDAEIALLLCLLENVVDLSIEQSGCSEKLDAHCKYEFYFYSILRATADMSNGHTADIHGLKSLKHISINAGGPDVQDDTYPHPILADILGIPSLETFNAYGILDFWSSYTLCPDNSGIRAIKLDRCGLSMPALMMIVENCAGLDSFDIVYHNDEGSNTEHYIPEDLRDEEEGRTTWRSLIIALQSQSHHLKHLRLAASEYNSIDSVEHYISPSRGALNTTVGSLANFTALQHLSVTKCALLGPDAWLSPMERIYWESAGEDNRHSEMPETERQSFIDRLPQSLQSLEISGCTPMAFEVFEELLHQIPASLPALRHVKFAPIDPDFYLGDYHGNKTRLDKIKKELNALGITMERSHGQEVPEPDSDDSEDSIHESDYDHVSPPAQVASWYEFGTYAPPPAQGSWGYEFETHVWNPNGGL